MSDTVSLGLDEALFEFPPGPPADAPPVMAGVPAVLVWGGAVLFGVAVAAANCAITYLAQHQNDGLIADQNAEIHHLRQQVLELKAEQALTTGVGIEELPLRYQAILDHQPAHNTDISISW
jgi:hypothetical protein